MTFTDLLDYIDALPGGLLTDSLLVLGAAGISFLVCVAMLMVVECCRRRNVATPVETHGGQHD